MPNRILREGILSSERVDKVAGELSVEVTFRRLFSVADDFGRFSAHPSLVRAAVYPLRLDQYTDAQITDHLMNSEAAGLIRLYQVHGKRYLELLDFRQKTRAKSSKYPAPDGHAGGTCVADDQQMRTESETESESRDGDERRRRDIDSLATPVQPNRISQRCTPEDLLLVKRAIAEYMQSDPDDNLVLQVIEAGGGASADDICLHFKTLWVSGHKPGKAKGPRSFGWFVAVTRQYFADLRAMENARRNPGIATHWSEVEVSDGPDLDAGLDTF
jgi:hypothetical protein